jgi:signal transduction histidine kinase
VAVKGPTEEITRTLETIELSYSRGESLAGRIFETKEHIFLNRVGSEVEYVSEYVQVLPSKRIVHYIGVPLIIGNEILGVIRVINKKAPGYSESKPILCEEGFDGLEDVELIKTIAIQVAAAIKNAKLLKSEKLAAIGKLAQTTGHEIKTNLGTVLNYIDGLKYSHESEKDAETLGIYTDIQDALWAARNQLQNMLMAAKPKVAEKQPIQLEELLYDFQEKLKREAAYTQINFSIECPATSREFLADAEQLQQVLSNLFDNSVYAIQQKMAYSPGFSNGQISMAVHLNLDKLQIVWKDNGTGISKTNLPSVFTPFFTNKDSGNGLGLFISKAVIENHNGTIAVNSEEGEGSTFVIELPLLLNGEPE